MSYSRTQMVTASKNYRCFWCGERIVFRERYIRQTCADGPRHWRNRWHAECWQAWLHLPHDEQEWWNDEGCVPKYVRGLTLLQEHAEKENLP